MRVLHRIVTLSAGIASSAGALGTLGMTAGCGSPPPRAPHAMHAIPEPRARELIARTFRDAGVVPEADRFVRIGPGDKRVRLEVAAVGRMFGVAYLTADDWEKAGDALPPRRPDGSLAVATGEGGTHILCLFADDYTEDDQTGDERTSTTIAADGRLERDVRDFLHRAEEKQWR